MKPRISLCIESDRINQTTMVCSITPGALFQLGIEMMGREGKSEAKSQEDFVTQFGTSPQIVAEVARLLETNK